MNISTTDSPFNRKSLEDVGVTVETHVTHRPKYTLKMSNKMTIEIHQYSFEIELFLFVQQIIVNSRCWSLKIIRCVDIFEK